MQLFHDKTPGTLTNHHTFTPPPNPLDRTVSPNCFEHVNSVHVKTSFCQIISLPYILGAEMKDLEGKVHIISSHPLYTWYVRLSFAWTKMIDALFFYLKIDWFYLQSQLKGTCGIRNRRERRKLSEFNTFKCFRWRFKGYRRESDMSRLHIKTMRTHQKVLNNILLTFSVPHYTIFSQSNAINVTSNYCTFKQIIKIFSFHKHNLF